MLNKLIFCMKNTDIVKGNADVLKAAGFSVYLAGKPDELETRKWHEDALLVTDYEDRRLADIFLEMPRIGYGLSYHGSAKYVVCDMETLDKSFLEMVYCRYYSIPLVIAETPRLLIREMSLSDLDNLYELYGTLKDCPYIEQLYDIEGETEFTKNYIQNMYGFFGYGLWLVIRKADNRLIGRAGIENREINGTMEKELGYLIGRPWQKQGYAKEACEAIISYAAEYFGRGRLFLCSHKQNIPSIHLAEKLAFKEYAKDIDGMNIYCRYL